MPRRTNSEELQDAQRFGALVFARRMEAGLSRYAVAKMCGLSTNALESIETGRFLPRLSSTYRLLRLPVLGLAPADLPAPHRVQVASLQRAERELDSVRLGWRCVSPVEHCTPSIRPPRHHC